MSYPCRECGTNKGWSIFSDEEKVSFDVLKVFPSESVTDGCYIIEHSPSADKDYKVIIRAWINGLGKTAYMEKLK